MLLNEFYDPDWGFYWGGLQTNGRTFEFRPMQVLKCQRAFVVNFKQQQWLPEFEPKRGEIGGYWQ